MQFFNTALLDMQRTFSSHFTAHWSNALAMRSSASQALMPPKLRQHHIEDFCYRYNDRHRIGSACAQPHSCIVAPQETVEISRDSEIIPAHSPARTAQSVDLFSSVEGLPKKVCGAPSCVWDHSSGRLRGAVTKEKEKK